MIPATSNNTELSQSNVKYFVEWSVTLIVLKYIYQQMFSVKPFLVRNHILFTCKAHDGQKLIFKVSLTQLLRDLSVWALAAENHFMHFQRSHLVAELDGFSLCVSFIVGKLIWTNHSSITTPSSMSTFCYIGL